jgi:hypothetical protein
MLPHSTVLKKEGYSGDPMMWRESNHAMKPHEERVQCKSNPNSFKPMHARIFTAICNVQYIVDLAFASHHHILLPPSREN